MKQITTDRLFIPSTCIAHTTCALCLLVSLFVVSSFAKEKTLPSRFERVQEIEGSFTKGQQGKLIVPENVFGQSRHFPNDLRIFGSNETQWPFFLYIPREKSDTKKLNPKILNRSFVAGHEPYLQFDLVIPSVEGRIPIHNQIELATTGHDFVRRVEVFTANPNEPTGLLASGFLIDFSRQRNAKNRIIRYPNSDAGRLHIRIYSNAQVANETFDMTSAQILYHTVSKLDYEQVNFEKRDVPERDQEKNAQTLIFDIGTSNRPVECITFDVENTSFARSVSIYGRNIDSEPWQWVGGGEIHALIGNTNTTINLSAKDRFLKVQIFHYDDQPLLINGITLQARPRFLVFEAASDGSAGLYYRAWDIKSPRYDLEGRIKKKTIPELPIFQTLDAAPNTTAKIQAWRKYAKLLGILAVGAVSILVIGIIVSMLKQQGLSGDET